MKRTVNARIEESQYGILQERKRQIIDDCQKVRVSRAVGYMKNLEGHWLKRFDEARQWKELNGSYPKKSKKSDDDELRLYRWLWKNLPGKSTWRGDRWDLLNEAFGEGWEKECFPRPKVKGAAVLGYMRNEPQWDATLEQVKHFRVIKGRFPKKSEGPEEAKLYEWLRNSSSRSSGLWSAERVKKLDEAFGEGWGRICFPRSIYYM